MALAEVADFFFSRTEEEEEEEPPAAWRDLSAPLPSSVLASRFFWLSRFTRFPRPRLPVSESGECDRAFGFALLAGAEAVASWSACNAAVGGLMDMLPGIDGTSL